MNERKKRKGRNRKPAKKKIGYKRKGRRRGE
jgi:hypothetical protein